ncbi:MAG TPA: hypothetical protein DGX96_01045 [Lachnospiraceae bacterium]|jgi:hypothetical protein|nr:hypothetical protein [Lachnospiraceae bacterium]
MEMTGDQIDAFRKDFNEAMKALEEKYDITLRLGTITYYKDYFESTLHAEKGRDPEKIAEQQFDRDALYYQYDGIHPGMYRQVFVSPKGTVMALIGFRKNAKKYPLLVQDIHTGLYYRAPLTVIKEFRNEKFFPSTQQD